MGRIIRGMTTGQPMKPPDLYPKAKLRLDGGRGRNGKGWGAWLTGPQNFAVVLHTSETSGNPSYWRDYGNVAPHLDYDPVRHEWTQRTRHAYYAGTLAGSTSSGGPTNSAKVLQVEILCYSNKTIADKYGRLWIGNLDREAARDLADWLAWCHRHFGVPLILNPKNTSTGTDHMGFDEWWTTRDWGICEHARAFNNSTHWDCGALNTQWIVRIAVKRWLDSLSVLQPGRFSWRTRFLKGGLRTAGFWDGSMGRWFGKKLADAVREWQETIGRPVTGHMKRADWAALAV